MTKVKENQTDSYNCNDNHLQDFNNDNASDCVSLEVSALSIMESEDAYVNILLGDYQEPEVR